MSSSSSYTYYSTSGMRGGLERGFPKSCWCGEGSVIRTSKTQENPGRLFHKCPFGSEKVKNHLFKWTDESLVEEVKDMKYRYEKKLEELSVVVNGFKKEIEDMKAIIQGYEKEKKEVLGEVQNLKNMMICGFGMIMLYSFVMA